MEFPPHTRGWTVWIHASPQRSEVSPAHAGMDLWAVRRDASPPCFPRTRGDGPHPDGGSDRIPLFPPHTRGWTHEPPVGEYLGLVSPAHAGMDRPSRLGGWQRFSFPRTRGDGPVVEGLEPCEDWFPPHTRGWTSLKGEQVEQAIVSPAHAGMDRR